MSQRLGDYLDSWRHTTGFHTVEDDCRLTRRRSSCIVASGYGWDAGFTLTPLCLVLNWGEECQCTGIALPSRESSTARSLDLLTRPRALNISLLATNLLLALLSVSWHSLDLSPRFPSTYYFFSASDLSVISQHHISSFLLSPLGLSLGALSLYSRTLLLFLYLM